MLMWEIFAGHPPFNDIAHDHCLIFQICEGLRPQILPEIPDDYAQMMKKCWDADLSKRPTIEELCEFADDKLEETYESKIDSNSDGNINDGTSSNNLLQVHKTHPLA